jgi:hypothetical protein
VSLFSLVKMETLLRAAVKSAEMKFLAEWKVRLAFGSAILTFLVVGAISYRAAVYQG